MIKLENLPGDKGALQNRKRIGRGIGSGTGKQAGKGHKGAQARSGTPKGNGFEGGQTPLSRRLPKRGFSNKPWATPTAILNISQFEKFEDGATVDFAALVASGLIGRTTQRVKVLGDGKLTKKLTVQVDAFSATAKKRINAAGGECQETSTKIVKRQSSDGKESA